MPRRRRYGARRRRRRRPGDAESRDWVFGVHAPPGTGVAEVFGDLVAAIVTERARRIADLADPAAAFGERAYLGRAHGRRAGRGAGRVRDRADGAGSRRRAVRSGLGLPPIGAAWRDRAARADYFASTARLADGIGAWAMLAARLGDRTANRAFAERWWHGAIRGADVLFPAGESMAAALRAAEGDGGLLAGVRRLVQVRAGKGPEPGGGTDGGGRRPHPSLPAGAGL